MTRLLLDVLYAELGLAAPRHPEASYQCFVDAFDTVKSSLVTSPEGRVLHFGDCDDNDLGRLQLDRIQEGKLFIALYRGINSFNKAHADADVGALMTDVVIPVCKRMLSENEKLRAIVSVQARAHAERHGAAVRGQMMKVFPCFGLDREILAARSDTAGDPSFRS